MSVKLLKYSMMIHENCLLHLHFFPPVTLTFCAFLSLLPISLPSFSFAPCFSYLLVPFWCPPVSALPPRLPCASPFCCNSRTFTLFDRFTFSDDQFLPPRCPLPSPPNLTFCTLPSLPTVRDTTAPSFLQIPDPRVMRAGRPGTNPVAGGRALPSARLRHQLMIPAQI